MILLAIQTSMENGATKEIIVAIIHHNQLLALVATIFTILDQFSPPTALTYLILGF